ncbi:MAG: ElyC/SanA/YdcF family protein [Nanoarchaeota archaeon]
MGKNFDAILLPTGETSFGDRTFPVSQEVVSLFNSGRFGCIFVSGGYNGFSRVVPEETEADETVEYLLGRNIPKEKIYSDSQSHETIGNFTFPLLQPMAGNPKLSDFGRILVVGKKGHMWRIRDYSDLIFDKKKNNLDFRTIPGRHNDGLLTRIYHHAIMNSLRKLEDAPCAENVHRFILENHPFYSDGWYNKSLPKRKLEMSLTGLRWVI